MLIKAVNKLTKKEEKEAAAAAAAAAAAPTTKVCPECLSEVPVKAKRCKFCTSVLPEEKVDTAKA